MDSSRIIPRAIALISILVILGYITFRFYPLVSGPHIHIVSPQNGEGTAEQIIEIVVETERVQELRIQDNTVDIEEGGISTYRYVLAEGINRITLYGEDQYGKSTESIISVIKK